MIRHLRVLARLALRWIVRRWTGRYLTVLLPTMESVMPAIIRRVIDQRLFLRMREDTNAALLTGMIVGLQTGSRPWFTGWESYKNAARVRSYAKNVPTKLVARPVVYRDRLGNKLGMTEFLDTYISREERRAK